jgi:flagellar hook-associated protein FlgK
MVYKEKVLGLTDALEAKLRLIENVANGNIKMDGQQINQLIQQMKNLREQIYDLVSIERD